MTDPANPSEARDGGPAQPAAIANAARDLDVLHFVTPSTYLRAPVANNPTASNHSRTDFPLAAEKPLMTPLDREQMQGLVSLSDLRTETFIIPRCPFPFAVSCAVGMGILIPRPPPPLVPCLRGHCCTVWPIQRGSASSRGLHDGAGYWQASMVSS